MMRDRPCSRINSVGAVISDVAVERCRFLFHRSGSNTFRKSFAFSNACDLHRHSARWFVHNHTRGPVIDSRLKKGLTLNRDQSPSSQETFTELILLPQCR